MLLRCPFWNILITVADRMMHSIEAPCPSKHVQKAHMHICILPAFDLLGYQLANYSYILRACIEYTGGW